MKLAARKSFPASRMLLPGTSLWTGRDPVERVGGLRLEFPVDPVGITVASPALSIAG